MDATGVRTVAYRRRSILALADARSVVNIGAGTGCTGRVEGNVVALEPSLTMIRQRPPDAAPVVRASAESLPFGDDAFDAALAVLTMHHWPDPVAGLPKRRASRRGNSS